MLLTLLACAPADVSWTRPGGVEVSAPSVTLTADRDDDDGDGADDWTQDAPPEGEDDWQALEWTGEATLLVEGDGLRVWSDDALLLDGEGTVALGPGGTLWLQASEPGAQHTLRWVPEPLGPVTTVPVTVAPALLASHVATGDAMWVVSAVNPDRGLDNSELVADLAALMGDGLTVLDAEDYWYDLWVQDEIQWTWVDTERHVVLDSIRDRNLDDFPEERLLGPQVSVLTYGDGLPRNQDAFGNLEAFPPLDTGLVGPTYVGFAADKGPREGVLEFLDQQGQDRLTVDVSWLCVGHVDEVLTVVPDPDAPRGFVVWLADPGAMRDLLERADPALPLPRYAEDFGYDTVGDLLDDDGLWALDQLLVDDYLDPLAAELTAALSLSPEELVRVPVLYDEWTACSGKVSAVVPNLVNLAVVHPDGEPVVLVPDPWLRDGDDRGEDLLLDWLTDHVSTAWQPLEVWDTYHLNGGAVHCGTSVRRRL